VLGVCPAPEAGRAVLGWSIRTPAEGDAASSVVDGMQRKEGDPLEDFLIHHEGECQYE
jgi:hypothetical protein